jgi:very-short-patch-repair endonuclease
MKHIKTMTDDLHKGADPKLFLFARENRKTMTEAEKVLWTHLRNRKTFGFKFRRQHPLAGFIADFFCLECNLVIEVDGFYHNEREQSAYDKSRTHVLNELNVKVIRFTNREVVTNTDVVIMEIKKT